jgi:hypothetical protein
VDERERTSVANFMRSKPKFEKFIGSHLVESLLELSREVLAQNIVVLKS